MTVLSVILLSHYLNAGHLGLHSLLDTAHSVFGKYDQSDSSPYFLTESDPSYPLQLLLPGE